MPIRNAAEIGAEMLVDRAQSVMTGKAATPANLHLEGREIELVMEDGQRIGLELVEPQRLTDRAAAFVHEGGGLQQQDLLPADPPFPDPALELLLHGAEIMRFGNDVARHEADIVPVERVARSGIAEAGPDLHGEGL